jgi:hypothetical protein
VSFIFVHSYRAFLLLTILVEVIGAGASFAGIALAMDTRTAYATLVVINGLPFILAALMFLRLPLMPKIRKDGTDQAKKEPRFLALPDKRYVSATILNGIYSIHFIIQGVGIPLWIVNYTSAPRWTVSVVLLINTIACVVYTFAQGTSPIFATTLLVVGMLFHVTGELLGSGAGWGQRS